MAIQRSSGILLHPTSLPGPYGIGDLGPAAYQFVDFLAASQSHLWQVLPLGPTGYGDSPYQCFSAFAGNPYLISPDKLLEEGLLLPEDVADMPSWPTNKVDFGMVYQWKPALLDKAYSRFIAMGQSPLRVEFNAFCFDQASWLEDYALFMAIKELNGGIAWNEWPAEQRQRTPQAMHDARKMLDFAVQKQFFQQFLFFRQWHSLKQYANQKGVQIVGDIPIFVAMDSADAWAHSGLFYLDEQGKPSVVAGVPPDYFSATGQLWGNPLFNWAVHQSTGYQWWLERIRATLKVVDVVRIDHFRGFAGYWEIPGDAATAEHGRWVPGPGKDFFNAVRNALGELPIIAEDLGEITPDVVELRDSFGLPGMKIFQFGFSGPDNPFLPHHFAANSVVYSGTHDNDTALGWYRNCPPHERDFYHRYVSRDNADVPGDMIRAIWASVAGYAIAPLQDFLRLGSEARMNFPGKVGGYWAWRMPENALSDELKGWIAEMNYLYQR